ncbi:MAG: toxin-antitoxin system HicB family antitoxin [Solirubrobacterales bacterium]|nr:toxin-antitoxin system HicB family antitoxin [Solirubrobacterales bacterium]
MATLQVRNVPPDLHARLKARAAETGQSLSDYLLEELRSVAQRPTLREWVDEVACYEPSELTMTPAEAISAERRRAS